MIAINRRDQSKKFGVRQKTHSVEVRTRNFSSSWRVLPSGGSGRGRRPDHTRVPKPISAINWFWEGGEGGRGPRDLVGLLTKGKAGVTTLRAA